MMKRLSGPSRRIAHASMDGNNSGRVNAEVFNEFKNSDLANSDFSVIVNC